MNMAEKPILFNGEMVRAILEGRKTQTRRPVKPQPVDGFYLSGDRIVGGTGDRLGPGYIRSPFGETGDTMWVRETWMSGEYYPQYPGVRDVVYATDEDAAAWGKAHKWTPSIHMPRWASRITLKVKRVWVERVQDISYDDARAEGIERHDSHPTHVTWKDYSSWDHSDDWAGWISAINSFNTLWDSIYMKNGYGWTDNLWVWCCEFEVI